VSEHFVPVEIHVKDRLHDFVRFGVDWTPTLIFLEADGTERYRYVGSLPADDFLAHLKLGLAKTAFARREFDRAISAFESLAAECPHLATAPEAIYWAAASAYKHSGDAEFLEKGGVELRERYPESEWAKKASVWLPK
jgi:TolA-binding protein